MWPVSNPSIFQRAQMYLMQLFGRYGHLVVFFQNLKAFQAEPADLADDRI